jgi:hypothetical protein
MLIAVGFKHAFVFSISEYGTDRHVCACASMCVCARVCVHMPTLFKERKRFGMLHSVIKILLTQHH